jgi:hypothetical protein
MKVKCPSCHTGLVLKDEEETDIETDLATCYSCGATFSVVNFPPPGTWFEQLPNGFHVGASTRSWQGLIFIPFIYLWAKMPNSNIYWEQIRSGQFTPGNLYPSLLFLLGSLWFVVSFPMTVAGKIELLQIDDGLKLFIGIGSLGWSRNYLWSDFNTVRIDSFPKRTVIVLVGKRKVVFGSLLNSQKRIFVLNVLQKMLRDKQSNTTPMITASASF